MINQSVLSPGNKTMIILGDKQTGKTSILQKYSKQRFYENYTETIGVDFYSKVITVEQSYLASDSVNFSVSESVVINNHNITMNIWDTSGIENDVKIINKNLYKNSDAFLICCSYDSLESLSNVKNWLNHISSILDSERRKDLPIFILCNKFDLVNKKFGNKEIKTTLQEDMNILKGFGFKIKLYHRISAKSYMNIEYVFEKLIYYMTNTELKVLKCGAPIDNQSEQTRRQTLSSERKKTKININTSQTDITFDIDAQNVKSFVLSGKSIQSKHTNKSFNMDKCRSSCCK